MALLKTLAKGVHGIRECAKLPTNVYKKNGKVLVSKVKSERDLKATIKKSVDLIGGFSKVIKKGDKVLIKPNYVFPSRNPCCTASDFLQATIQLVKEQHPSEIVVGECCFGTHSTRSIMEKLGAMQILKREKVPLLAFEEGEWISVKLKSDTLADLGFAKKAFDFDKIVYLPCMKTHKYARFTLALKLTMGFTHPRERWTKIVPGSAMHEERIGDLNKAIHPDLIILDGRKAFVTEGPQNGQIVRPNVIMASGDRIALDVEAVRILQSYKADNKLDKADPWQYTQITRAIKNKLGARSQDEVKLV